MPTETVTFVPFANLAQRNAKLLFNFWASPAVLKEAQSAGEALTRQAQTSSMNLMQSSAFFQLIQGLMASQTEFLQEAARSQFEKLVENRQQAWPWAGFMPQSDSSTVQAT